MGERLEKYYGRSGARVYDITTRLSGYRGYYTTVLQAAGVKKEGRVLDVGCGTGMFSASLERYGTYDLTGVDISPATLQFARRNAPTASLYVGDVFDLRNAHGLDGLQADITEKKYDLVVSAGMLEYLDTPGEALRIMLSLLKDDGMLITTTIKNNVVGYIASKLYGFSLIEAGLLSSFQATEIPLHFYPNVYLRTLKQSHSIRRGYVWTEPQIP